MSDYKTGIFSFTRPIPDFFETLSFIKFFNFVLSNFRLPRHSGPPLVGKRRRGFSPAPWNAFVFFYSTGVIDLFWSSSVQ
jgi:hypothetical protein